MDTAQSSSLVAVHLACESLRRGESGGPGRRRQPQPRRRAPSASPAFGALSPDGRCNTFDAAPTATCAARAAAWSCSSRWRGALRRRRPVYCVIRGSAVNNDGGERRPDRAQPPAQEEVIRAAYRRAGVDPGEVQYVEAHGTGTTLGDPIEAQRPGRRARPGRAGRRAAAVGSVKTNIGHLEAAAGIAGLIKVLLAIEHAQLPPSLQLRRAQPAIPLGARCGAVQTGADALAAPRTGPAVAGVSSFGMGGTNCHLVLAEAAGRRSSPTREPLARGRCLLSPATGEALRGPGRAAGGPRRRDRTPSRDSPRRRLHPGHDPGPFAAPGRRRSATDSGARARWPRSRRRPTGRRLVHRRRPAAGARPSCSPARAASGPAWAVS